MSLETKKKALYDWLVAETGLTVIQADQKAPRPDEGYCSYKYINPSLRVGGMDSMEVDGSNFNLSGLRSTVLSINIFGKGANDLLGKVRDSLDKPEVIEAFDLEGLAVYEENGPNDLTALLETQYEERSQMDLSFYFAQDTALETSYIDSVEIVVDVNDREQTLLIEET